MKIFEMDGPIYKAGTELADVFILTLWWFIGCIPIVSIGASTTALFYVYGKKVRGEDAYVTRDFFKSYKENFLQSIPITLIMGLVWASAFLYRSILDVNGQGTSFVLVGLALFIILEASIMTIYVFAILSRFHMKNFNVFVTAFVLAHKHLASTLIMVALVIVIQYASLMMPLLLIVTPTLTVALCSFFIQKNFTLHIKASEEAKKRSEETQSLEDDQDTEEDEEDEEYEDEEDDEVDEEDGEDKSYLKYI